MPVPFMDVRLFAACSIVDEARNVARAEAGLAMKQARLQEADAPAKRSGAAVAPVECNSLPSEAQAAAKSRSAQSIVGFTVTFRAPSILRFLRNGWDSYKLPVCTVSEKC